MNTLFKTSAITLALAFGANAAVAQDFPVRPVNLVAPFNAGGGTDLLLRGFGPHFAEALGGDVFVSNMAVALARLRQVRWRDKSRQAINWAIGL